LFEKFAKKRDWGYKEEKGKMMGNQKATKKKGTQISQVRREKKTSKPSGDRGIPREKNQT